MPTYRYSLLHCVFLALLISGCSSIKIKTVNTKQSLMSQRSSILTSSNLSPQTNATLISAGSNSNRCLSNLGDCVQQLSTSNIALPSDLHSALAEIYLAFALQYKSAKPCQTGGASTQVGPKSSGGFSYVLDPAQIKQCQDDFAAALIESLRFSYAYLFLDDITAKQRTFSDREIAVNDFYEAAVRLITPLLYDGDYNKKEAKLRIADFQIKLDESQANLLEPLQDIQSAAYLQLEDLNESVRDGFGVPYVAQLQQKNTALNLRELVVSSFQGSADAATNTLSSNDSGQIVQSNFIPRTVVFKPLFNTAAEAFTTQQFELQIIDPLAHRQITLEGQTYPLAANFSAPYVLWVKNSRYEQTAYLNFFAGFEALSKPQLYMLEPYDPNKLVIIMIHGLAASPASWVNLTNDLFGDSTLRQNFQVWQVFYSTNVPLLETRYDIEQLIQQAYQNNQRSSADTAQHNSVIVAHSMGSVIARMLVSDDDLTDEALNQLSAAQKNKLKNQAEFVSRFKLKPLEAVDRVVFMSSPFKGTDFADRWFTKALRRMARLPSAFLAQLSEPVINLLESEDNQVRLSGLRSLFMDVAASQLSDQSEFIKLTKDIEIVPGVAYHSIIGNNGDEPLRQSSDGVVPYTSAHLAGAESEKVIEGGHSIQNNPEAVIEIRRVLREHLLKHQGVGLPDIQIDQSIVDRAMLIGEDRTEQDSPQLPQQPTPKLPPQANQPLR